MNTTRKNLRTALSVFFIFLTLSIFGQTAETDKVHLKIQQQANQIFDSLVNLRRDFHRYPEIAKQEKRTSKKMQNI